MFEMLGMLGILNMFSSSIGIIGTTAAIVAGVTAVAAGGAAAYSSRQARKAAETQAEAQREATGLARSERAEELAFQRELAGPAKEFQERQLGLYKDVFEPGIRRLGTQIEEQEAEPFPQELWTEVFQRGRERIGREFGLLEQKTGERLAGAGPGVIRGGQATQLFSELGRERVRSVEDLAIDQAIAEFTETQRAKQQVLENTFRFMGGAPNVGQAQVQAPAYIPPYVPPVMPTKSTGIGEGVSTGLRVASLFAGGGGGSKGGGESSTADIAKLLGITG